MQSGRYAEEASYSVFIGDLAGEGDNSNKLDGDGNTAIGWNSGKSLISTAHSNTFIGATAGDVATTAVENTCLGFNADIQDATATNQIVIGNNITGTADSTVHIGNDSGHYTLLFEGSGASWAHSSDARMKENIEDAVLGLDFINKLDTVTYNQKPKSEYPEEWQDYDPEQTEKDTTKYYGFVAQEVKKAMNSCNADYFTGWTEQGDGKQRIGFASFVVPLVKAVQELSAKVAELEAKLDN